MVSMLLLLLGCVAVFGDVPTPMYHDVPPHFADKLAVDVCGDTPEQFKCLWINDNNEIVDDEDIEDGDKETHLEVAATHQISEEDHKVGTEIIQLMVRNMPEDLFQQLAARGRVGLFTFDDKTTIFPEYEHLRDTPECAGRCNGECAITCTGDGRKWDSLAGVGGVRGTCVDDNYMCTASDPYRKTDNILMHEFAHTIHLYAIPYVSGDWSDRISAAYQNALDNEIWESNSYAMVNAVEYFAEGAGVFFNVNHHSSSTGGMNSCGQGTGYCECPEDAREWLQSQDPLLYEALVFTFTDGNDYAPGNLHICMTEPNNEDCEL